MPLAAAVLSAPRCGDTLGAGSLGGYQGLGSRPASLRGRNEGTPLPLQALPQLQLRFRLERSFPVEHSWLERFMST